MEQSAKRERIPAESSPFFICFGGFLLRSAFLHDIIGEQDAVSSDLLLFDDGISARFKEGSRRDRSMRCIELTRDRRFQRIAEGSCDAAPQEARTNIQMIEVSRFVHIGESDDRFALNGDECQMRGEQSIPRADVDFGGRPSVALIAGIVFPVDRVHGLAEQGNDCIAVR